MCQAINSNITGPASNSITLDINLKPTEVRITQLTPILVAGSEALFECNTFGSRPMPAIYWRFDGRKYETRIHGEQQTTSTLTLRLDRHHRGLTVECIVENLRIPGSALRDQLVLDVQYPPQLSLKLGAPSLSLDAIQEGIDIYFDCHVDANPPPTTPITWLFNGQPLLPEPGVIESNQSLVLQRVQRWRNGTYQCTCSNNQGTVISNEIELEIKFSPVCATPFTLIYGLNLNEHVQIVCNVESRPAKASFSWKFEKTTNLASFVQLNDSKSILEYVPRHRDQYGLIECTAKNDIGIQREPCRYLVVPLAGPFFPYNCAVANQSDSTLSIRCDGSIQLTNASSDPIGAVPTVYRGASEPAYDGPSDLEDTEDLEDEEVDSGPSNRIKYHNSQVLSHRRKLSENLNPPGLPLNLSTSDIYALYFAPDVDPGSQDPDADTTDGSGQRPGGTKLTYRNGIGPPGSAKMTQHQLAASANLLLNELVPKFNSYPISGSTHLFAYPPTYYICEIYAMTPRPTLIKNVTIDAVGRRIMNPFNGSFSFLVDSLPPNTPLRVNIYARNARKRSPIWVELDAQTQRAAERRIDSAQQGGPGDQESVARGRKASFFEELYGGYGRFRSKHLVVGLLIGAVAVAVFVAILLIVIASLRNKTGSSSSSGGSQERQMSMLEQHGKLSGSFKRKNSSSTSRRPSTQLNLEDFKETTFMERTEENFDDDLGKGCGQQTNVDVLGPGAAAVAVPYDSYGPYGTLDGDDDSSMRSDHQLIQQTLEPQKYYTTQTRAQQRPGPPSYFDLEQSLGAAEGHPRTGGHAFVNLISPGGGHHPLEAKPDLIQTATIYSNASAKGDPVTTSGAIFDTISFESHGEAGGGGPGASGYEMSPMPTMIAVAAGGEQLSGNIIHFSPLRNHPSHSTLQRRYLGHPILTDGTSPSTTLSRGSSAAGTAQQPGGTTVLYEGPKQQSYIYIQHLGPELSGGPPDSTS